MIDKKHIDSQILKKDNFKKIESLFKSIRKSNQDSSRDISCDATTDTLSTSVIIRINDKSVKKVNKEKENCRKKRRYTEILSKGEKSLYHYKRFKQSSQESICNFTKIANCLEKIKLNLNII